MVARNLRKNVCSLMAAKRANSLILSGSAFP